MRLLKIAPDGLSLSFAEDQNENQLPPYVILSHTWGISGQEVVYKDIAESQPYDAFVKATDKDGYEKIRFCTKQALADGFEHMWIDSCCIDKANFTELTQAINSMFRWYQGAARCYVYLPDVSRNNVPEETWKSDLQKTRWAERGWTLQELLAPSRVDFYSSEGQHIGDRTTLESILHDMTGIPVGALRGTPLCEFTELERMSWMHHRKTKLEEDKAYALLGIFDVQMPLIYGEGAHKAFVRLRRTIEQDSGRNDPIESAPKSHFLPTVGRNKDFVGRRAILDSLMRKISPDTSKDTCQMTVIEGLGGIGKTQIAVEAIYRMHDRDPDCSIFWIPVVDNATIENAYRRIGQELQIEGIDDNRADVRSLVKNFLSNDSAGSWLLVIDNVDDVDLMFGTEEETGLYDSLPASGKGSILCTTRTHEVTVKLDVSLDDVFSIKEMDEEEGLQLLRKKCSDLQLHDGESTHMLLEFLAYLPLAIRQASAYMSRTRMTTTAYLKLCNSSDKTQIDLLSQHFEDQSRYKYDKRANPIATTWLISFDHMSVKYPLASQYLRFLCFLAEKDIPTSLLPEHEDELERLEAIAALENYAFITLRSDSESLDIHRLVRLAARNWTKQERSDQIKTVVQHVSSVYPDPTSDNKPSWINYLPHGDAVLDTWIRENHDNIGWSLLIKTGASHFILGKAQLAESKYRLASEISEKTDGLGHPNTITSVNGLATTLRQQAKYEEAEKRLRQILESSAELPGQEHQNIIAVRNGLAELFRQSGRYREAEPEHERTLNLCLEILGESHPNTLASMNNLAIVLSLKGNYHQAEVLCQNALQRKTGVLGVKHPDVLASLNSLAVIHDLQGRYKDSERQQLEALQQANETYGNEHPETMAFVTNLASVLYRQGRYSEAEEQHRWAIKVISRELSRAHPDALANSNGLAESLRQQGRCSEAEQLHRETLMFITKTLGPQHPSTLFVTTNLAATLVQRGEYVEAKTLFQQALSIKIKVLGEEHPSIAASISGLADILLAQQRYEEAEKQFRRVVHSRTRILGILHPLTVTSMNKFALAYCLRRRRSSGEASQTRTGLQVQNP